MSDVFKGIGESIRQAEVTIPRQPDRPPDKCECESIVRQRIARGYIQKFMPCTYHASLEAKCAELEREIARLKALLENALLEWQEYE